VNPAAAIVTELQLSAVEQHVMGAAPATAGLAAVHADSQLAATALTAPAERVPVTLQKALFGVVQAVAAVG